MSSSSPYSEIIIPVYEPYKICVVEDRQWVLGSHSTEKFHRYIPLEMFKDDCGGKRKDFLRRIGKISSFLEEVCNRQFSKAKWPIPYSRYGACLQDGTLHPELAEGSPPWKGLTSNISFQNEIIEFCNHFGITGSGIWEPAREGEETINVFGRNFNDDVTKFEDTRSRIQQEENESEKLYLRDRAAGLKGLQRPSCKSETMPLVCPDTTFGMPLWELTQDIAFMHSLVKLLEERDKIFKYSPFNVLIQSVTIGLIPKRVENSEYVPYWFYHRTLKEAFGIFLFEMLTGQNEHRICKNSKCSVFFKPKNKISKYCSPECLNRENRNKHYHRNRNKIKSQVESKSL